MKQLGLNRVVDESCGQWTLGDDAIILRSVRSFAEERFLAATEDTRVELEEERACDPGGDISRVGERVRALRTGLEGAGIKFRSFA